MRILSFLLVLFSLFYSTSFSQWVEQSSGTTEQLDGVSFTDSDNGTAVGYNGTILRTTDGGTTWVSQNSGTTYI
ncbi:MAG: hypothetical protein IIB08_06895, partial [Bacteroidetes bacterium]|nr:hypothetical protein [Bacteroidota bacterium]